MKDFLIISAFLLDIILGDPRYGFHPIILIGKLIRFIEMKMNKDNYLILKGVGSTFFILLVIYSIIISLQSLLLLSGFWISFIIQAILIYTMIALGDLVNHAKKVFEQLEKGDLVKARFNLSYMVGRKTENLDETEIVRATIESVAENLVDGVTAPLFYAFLFGLPGIFIYKTINTLDSHWGHRNERFEKFGKFAARLDDVANLIPARLTAPMIGIASFFVTQRPIQSFKVLYRDGRKHPSPNSGLSEAAMAGALGVRLGGFNTYSGHSSFREYLGIEEKLLSKEKINEAITIIFLTSFIFIVSILTLKVIVVHFY